MGNKLIRLSFLSLVSVVSPLMACASDPTSAVEAVEVSGHSLELDNHRCVLSVLHGGSVTSRFELKLEPPCYFSRSGRDIQKYAFEEAAVDNVLVVVGTPVTEHHIDKWDLIESDAESCGTQHQGVLISGSGVKRSRRTSSGGLACRYYGVDKNVFWGYAHESE